MSKMNKKQDTAVQRTAKNLFSGFMGGIANCLTGHPFDTLKVHQLLCRIAIFTVLV